MASHVYSIERIAELRAMADANLSFLALENVTLSTGDGSLGLAQHAPYDRILVAASAPHIPSALVDQLVDGGVMVMPVGDRAEQTLVRVVRSGTRITKKSTLACRFVKLIGEAGWHADD
jgi:protein-L-isoaspartate(D-aspartate) O-methyltransferase